MVLREGQASYELGPSEDWYVTPVAGCSKMQTLILGTRQCPELGDRNRRHGVQVHPRRC